MHANSIPHSTWLPPKICTTFDARNVKCSIELKMKLTMEIQMRCSELLLSTVEIRRNWFDYRSRENQEMRCIVFQQAKRETALIYKYIYFNLSFIERHSIQTSLNPLVFSWSFTFQFILRKPICVLQVPGKNRNWSGYSGFCFYCSHCCGCSRSFVHAPPEKFKVSTRHYWITHIKVKQKLKASLHFCKRANFTMNAQLIRKTEWVLSHEKKIDMESGLEEIIMPNFVFLSPW